jgi:hypothetical protein
MTWRPPPHGATWAWESEARLAEHERREAAALRARLAAEYTHREPSLLPLAAVLAVVVVVLLVAGWLA